MKITPIWNALPTFFAKFSPSENNYIYNTLWKILSLVLWSQGKYTNHYYIYSIT